MTSNTRPPKRTDRPENLSKSNLGWVSDVAAEMLRRLNIDYISLVPGASYRGLHDSIVNYLGNEKPQIVLTITEQAAVGIAQGYAKVSGKPMAVALHANIGLMHGLVNVFDAYCDRVPMVIVGATGPVDAAKRRPWIDWVHTSKDQGALIRNFSKWDDQPASAEALVESFLRAAQISQTAPMGPVYVCLDAELQEKRLERPPDLPDVKRYAAPIPPGPDQRSLDRAVELVLKARNPVILAGRVSRDDNDWSRRVKFAEALGAPVYTAIKLATAFPTNHELHAGTLSLFPDGAALEALEGADLAISLDWPDLRSTLTAAGHKKSSIKVINASMDQTLHNGWNMDYLGIPPVDLAIPCDPDAFVGAVVGRVAATNLVKREYAKIRRVPKLSVTETNPITVSAMAKCVKEAMTGQSVSYLGFAYGWPIEFFPFEDPLGYLGADAGGVVGAGPSFAVGAALALLGSGKIPVMITGDGDFLSGMTALWTAARMKIPLLFIIKNNRSFFNDEMHQERVAQTRGRPTVNRWIGQRLDDPPPDLAALALAQGIDGVGPITDVEDLANALDRGISSVKEGEPFVIDVVVEERK